MKKTMALVCALLLVAMTLVPVFASAIANPFMYVKTGDGSDLTVRESPKTKGEVKGKIKYGTRVQVLENVNANWAFVEPDGWSNPGYVMRKCLTYDKPGKYEEKIVYVQYDYSALKHVEPYEATVTVGRAGGLANLRWAPNKGSAMMEKLSPGSVVKVIAQGGGWYQVIDETNDYIGFLYYTFLDV